MVRKSDLIFCSCDAISFAFLWGRMTGLHDAKLIVLFQSLSERCYRYFAWNPLAKFMVSKLLRHADVVLTLSSSAKSSLCRRFQLEKERVQVFHFGADITYWKYQLFEIQQRGYILSVGNDMNRDYETLFKALVGQYKIVIVSDRKILFRGVDHKKRISNHELLKLFQNASARGHSQCEAAY